MSEPRTIELQANGLRFAALEMGQGPLVLCLHGFPDTALTFKHQMPALAAAGYRVVAPYMRGYAPTEPAPDGNYQTASLGRDVLGLIDALQPGAKAILFGHDWGALASYAAAVLGPDKIDRIVTAAVPYGQRLATAFVESYEQQKRSWYMFFFQGPLAETAVAMNDFRFIRRLWKDWSPTWDFTEADIAPVIETLGKPGVLEAALGYYRCLLNPALQDPALMSDQMRVGLEPIGVPAMYMHGADDHCMGLEMTEGMEASFTAGLTKVVLDGAGHFVQLEKPQQVTERILAFLRE
ncbi:MAG TPA: alpha/beta hydrolase [Candidatus Limnocylindrales bacterium]|nr:alpha/beta hydrolase [Candidatus Limnocylindrales bacterium]